MKTQAENGELSWTILKPVLVGQMTVKRVRFELEKGIPTPIPTMGTPQPFIPSSNCNGFMAVQHSSSTPDFGRFYGSHGGCGGGASRARQKPPSSLTRPTSSPHGRVIRVKGQTMSFNY